MKLASIEAVFNLSMKLGSLHFRLASHTEIRHAHGMKPSLLLLFPFLLTQCGDEPKKSAEVPKVVVEKVVAAPVAPAPAPAKEAPKKVYWTQEMLHTEIKYHNPGYTGDGQFNIEGGNVIALSLRGAGLVGPFGPN